MAHFHKKIPILYILICGILLSWILYFYQQSFGALAFLTVIVFILFASKPLTITCQKDVCETTENSETLEWFNTLLQRWWLFSISQSENYFRTKLNKIIQPNTPEFLEFIQVDEIVFGEACPHANSVRLIEMPLPNKNPVYLTTRGLDKLVKFVKETRYYFVTLEFDVDFVLESTNITLGCKHKKFQNSSQIIVKDFSVKGLLNVKISLDEWIMFPHISGVSVFFSDKVEPKFDCKVSLNKISNLADRFKLWIAWIIHSQIIKQKFKLPNFKVLENISNSISYPQEVHKSSAKGVLVIRIANVIQPSYLKDIFKKLNLCTICFGDQSYEFRSTFQVNDLFSVVFLIHNIEDEQVSIKLKSQNPISIQTLAVFKIYLKDYPLEVNDKINISKTESQIELKMNLEYIRLNPISNEMDSRPFREDIDSGVVYVHIIAGQNLLHNTKTDTVDSYCVLFANHHKITSSKLIKDSRYPKWDTTTEFFVYSLDKVFLTFVVYNGRHPIDDGNYEIIGIFTLPLKEVTENMINRTGPLKEFGGNSDDNNNVGKINFSMAFQPIEAVKYASNVLISKDDQDNYLPHMHHHKNGMGNEKEAPKLKLVVKAARNLMRKDIIGLSDPYFIVRHNEEEIHKSKVINYCLAPRWKETVMVPQFKFQDILKIEIYDKDVIKRDDFMGQLILNAKVLHDLSMLNESKWFALENPNDGDIQIRAIFSIPDDFCDALLCHEKHHEPNSIRQEIQENFLFSDLSSGSSPTIQSDENLSKKRLFGELHSVTLHRLPDVSSEDYIFIADLRKLMMPSKSKHIIKAYSTSQIDKTIFFSNYAFAITYSPSKENLKLKFKLILKRSKRKVDECTIEIKVFADLLKNMPCSITMSRGSVIHILGRDSDN